MALDLGALVRAGGQVCQCRRADSAERIDRRHDAQADDGASGADRACGLDRGLWPLAFIDFAADGIARADFCQSHARRDARGGAQDFSAFARPQLALSPHAANGRLNARHRARRAQHRVAHFLFAVLDLPDLCGNRFGLGHSGL